jgi:hypothetical protein
MSASVICAGCGAMVEVPEGYARNKIQCPGCGVICPVPAGAAGGAAKGKPAKKAAAASQAPATPSFDPLAAEPSWEEPTPPAPPGGFDPFAGEEPRQEEKPPVREMTFKCRRCGWKVRRQGECPYCDAPPGPDAETAVETPVGVAPRSLELEEPPARPAEDDEDDGRPYLVADRDLPRCPKCRKEMEVGARVCVACGFNLRTRKKAQREYQPLERSWETNLPLRRRALLFVGVHGGSLLLGLVPAIHGSSTTSFLFCWAFFGTILAFLLGTFEKVDLTRDHKGRVVVRSTWRFCFIPFPPRSTEVRGFEGVVAGQYSPSGFWEWFIFFWLLLPGVLPALFWWYFVIHKNAYHVSLARDHGYPAVYVYRGRDEEQMRDVARTLSDASGLRLEGA